MNDNTQKLQAVVNRVSEPVVNQVQGKTKEQRLADIKLEIAKIFSAPAKVMDVDTLALISHFEGLPIGELLSQEYTVAPSGKWSSYVSKKGVNAGKTMYTLGGRFTPESNVVLKVVGNKKLILSTSLAIVPNN